MGFLARQGRSIINRVKDFGYALGYIGKLLSSGLMFIRRGRVSRKILVMQLLFTFVEALPICALLGIGIGTSIILMGNAFLVSLGQAQLTYQLLVIVVMREFGPLLIAFVVTARSATAIATEISTMVVNHEVEAYISVGVNPLDHIAAPRLLGVTFSLFFLNLYFSIFGLIAPAIVIQFISTTSISDYFNNLFTAIEIKYIVISILKSLIFGMIIATSATYYGFKAGRASTDIPISGLKAVSKSFSLCVLADVFITALSYIL